MLYDVIQRFLYDAVHGESDRLAQVAELPGQRQIQLHFRQAWPPGIDAVLERRPQPQLIQTYRPQLADQCRQGGVDVIAVRHDRLGALV